MPILSAHRIGDVHKDITLLRGIHFGVGALSVYNILFFINEESKKVYL